MGCAQGTHLFIAFWVIIAGAEKQCMPVDLKLVWILEPPGDYLKISKSVPHPRPGKSLGGGMWASAFFDTPQMTPIADKHGHHQYIHQRNDRLIHDEDKKAS